MLRHIACKLAVGQRSQTVRGCKWEQWTSAKGHRDRQLHTQSHCTSGLSVSQSEKPVRLFFFFNNRPSSARIMANLIRNPTPGPNVAQAVERSSWRLIASHMKRRQLLPLNLYEEAGDNLGRQKGMSQLPKVPHSKISAWDEHWFVFLWTKT